MTALSRTPLRSVGDGIGARVPLSPSHRRCPRCARTFYGPSARFCPFDGEGLEVLARPPPDALVGSLVDGRYEVEALVAQGATASVYRVRHRVLRRPFALKALRAELAADAELGARFLREARTLGSMSHPNIVRINDSGTLPSGLPYFVMEYLEGPCLDAVIQRHAPLEPGLVVLVGTGIAEGLLAAHRRGIVHRDLKPANVHVGRSARGQVSVKLLDFGLARALGQARLTGPSFVCGSPEYMSPEQAMGHEAGVPSDIYALGVVLYEMLTGRLPFQASSYVGLAYQHVYAPPPLERLAPACPLPLVELVLRCLEKSPSDRFGSMQELTERLAALGPPPSSSALAALRPPEGAPRPRRHAAAASAARPTLDLRVVARWLLLGCIAGLALLAAVEHFRPF